MRAAFLPLLLIGVSALPTPAFAQKASDSDDDDSVDIVVTGRAPPGAVIGDIPPENQLGPRAIASYGVGTISELLDQLALQTGSAQGDQPPVILVNGRRVSGVNEVSDLPTESVLRIDILPEEVAIKYGYSPEQKVVNIILRRRFRSLVFNLTGSTTTEGGGDSGSGDATVTRIHDNDRINIAARAKASAALFEDQRGIVPNGSTTFDLLGNIVAPGGGEISPALSALAGTPVTLAGVPSGIATPSLADFAALAGRPNITDDSAYRTLVPSQRDYSLNAVYAHALSQTITSSFNLKVEYQTSAAELGLPSGILSVPAGSPWSPFPNTVGVARYFGTAPLDQNSETTTVQAGATLNADLTKKWRLSVIGGYDHGETSTDVARGIDLSALQAAILADDPTVSPYGPTAPALLGNLLTNHARTSSDSGNASALLTGPLFALPAGPLRISLRLGGTVSATSSVTSGAMPAAPLDLDRTTGDAMASFDVPLASKQFLHGLGTLTANLNVSKSAVSHFETLDGFGYGLNWTPVKSVTLIAAVNDSEHAPTLQQLDSPTIATANVRVFDYTNGTTAMVTRTSGGNPNLAADNRHVFKLGGTFKPFPKVDLSITANYATSRTRNSIGAFPGATASLEAAFPERFTRDADGDLIALDARPVNFAEQDMRQLRWGFNFTQILRQPKRPQLPPGFVPRRRRSSAAPGAPPQSDETPSPPATPDATGTTPGTGEPSAGQDEIVVNGRPGEDDGGATTPPGGRRFGGRGGFGRGGFGQGGGFRPGGGRGPGGFGGGGNRGADNSARLEITVYHSWIFQDTVLVRNGLPLVDLLHGGTLGGGAQPRHRIEFNTGITDNGVGIRLTGQWQSAATVAESASPGNGLLHFSSLATFNLRGFVNLQQRIPKQSWARGTRLTLSVTNLLNQRQRVTNDAGVTPQAYSPGYVDPLGRTIALSIRKLF